MKVAVGVLCHNQLENKRTGLFDDCLASIRKNSPDVLVVADNGSTDGTAERLAELPEFVGFPRIPGFPPGNTCGYGMNKLAVLLADKADIIVLSNDDIVWQPDAFTRLKEVWEAAASELTIVSGLVEPTYQVPGKPPWNDPIAVVDGVLLRRSVPGGAWSYRAADTDKIFPVSTFPGVDDVPACHKLIGEGLQVGCVDLAEHAGAEQSTWGNGSERFLIEPLPALRERFGL
jgi:glycosyltransferase involved in cell wall biosynthesis